LYVEAFVSAFSVAGWPFQYIMARGAWRVKCVRKHDV
jgi:hypothetical protein